MSNNNPKNSNKSNGNGNLRLGTTVKWTTPKGATRKGSVVAVVNPGSEASGRLLKIRDMTGAKLTMKPDDVTPRPRRSYIVVADMPNGKPGVYFPEVERLSAA